MRPARPQATPETDSHANIVDIRRFSTHDGDGIRTTVFFKGCPLACLWCQNPESISPLLRPTFFRNRCIDCGLCVEVAENGEAARGEDGTVTVRTDVTREWQRLLDACPTGALTWDGTTYTVSKIVEIALRDRPFFRHGGGVTLSGGEPLFRARAAIELLRRLKAENIHTAVETALHVRTDVLAAALENLDLLYADVKLLDPARHKAGVGRDNALIKENLAFLLRSPRRDDVIVRTPLIPHFTTTVENITAIGRFLVDLYPEVRWELLNYNPLAAAKYDIVKDRRFAFARDQNPPLYTADEMAEFRGIARESGVRRLVVAD